MLVHAANVLLYLMGWLLFVAGQAQNSIRSSSNGLPDGLAGWHAWLSYHLVNLLQRGFWSGLFYGFIVHSATLKLQAAGLPVTSFMCAGVGGWFANGATYQIMGLLGARVEMSEKVPPANAQIVPQSPQNADNAKTGDKTL